MRYGKTEGVESGALKSNIYGKQIISESAMQEIKKYYGFDKPFFERYYLWLKNILVFDFGKSYVFDEPVMDVIISRLPVSLYFGFIGFLLSYIICVPLGIMKAVKNGSKFDILSSFFIIIGYSCPGWALGSLLLMISGGKIFPLGDFRSAEFIGKGFFFDIFPSSFPMLIDQLHHTLLPITAYLIGSFATLTILTKSSVLENIKKEYVTTAYAKGLDKKSVLYKHVLRNSMIPLATGLGHFLSLIFAGSFLIEKVFNINGMGLLGYTALIKKDYTLTLGILVISSFLLLIGNIISDFLYKLIDPRIEFN